MTQATTASLKVKNTFIDIEQLPEDDEWNTDSFCGNVVAKRQVSEPAPSIQRQISCTAAFGMSRYTVVESCAEVAEEEDEPETCEHVEPEEEPRKLVLSQCRSLPETHDDAKCEDFDLSAWGRVITCDPLEAPTGLNMLSGASFNEQVAAQTNLSQMNVMQMPSCYDVDPVQWSTEATPEEATSATMIPSEWSKTLTVMMRNLPNKYTQDLLIEEISNTCFPGSFDFFYLPIDPETKANKGYAFINFVDPKFAWMFKLAYDGRKMNRFNSFKHVSVSPATLQGFEANYAHYSSTRAARGEPSARPLFLRQPDPLVENMSPDSDNASWKRRTRRGGQSAIDIAKRQADLTILAQQQQQMFCNPNLVPALEMVTAIVAPPAVPSVEAQPALLAGGASRALKFCPHCGGKREETFKFCQYCGQSLP